jgi:RNA polymerase sigma factor (sigma-70 family)
MNPEPPDALLEQLNRGDQQAAAQLFTAYEPYLRMVVRRYLSDRLRSKFDSADVVQSVWVQVLRGLSQAEWHFAEKGELQALLVTIARRRLVSHYRHHRTALERELPGGEGLEMVPARRQPRPSELAQADELWAKLLNLCPPAHRDVLRLRRQGLLLAEIAARTGMHEGSVRRILRQLAQRLAMEEESSRARADRNVEAAP